VAPAVMSAVALRIHAARARAQTQAGS
jgi:hypothetical protein